MEIERRKLKRKPLADCTNTISRASSEIKKSFAKPKVQNPKKFESKTGRKNPPKDDTKTCGENPKKNDSKFNGENPKKHDSKISGENRKKHDSRTSGENSEKYDTSTSSNDAVSKEIQRFWPANPSVRRSTEAGLNGSKSIDQDEVPWSQSDTRKNAEVLPASCPPMVPIARFWKKLGKQVCEAGPSKAHTEEPVQKKKRRYSMPELLPRDFIEEQRAKFAEIDAFELEEEVASETELE
ncbi:uncharacterized protein LOC18431358 [Amborella trichopoda]|uniref:uncharacterized protein LOC18431358 n=1 Tax=Amborella trichopoda TaxID=13333 RepID=UPI0005D39BE8|nr:uncharacterized protein LOC18431358 [Amborella trichopoda]|eukprot:XP_011622254.1 uncharacterized protein LOC18431358 [Amborella trichopoda]